MPRSVSDLKGGGQRFLWLSADAEKWGTRPPPNDARCAEELRHRNGRPLQYIIHPALPPTSTAGSGLQGALQDRLREASVSGNMPEARQRPSTDSCW